jgi:hypothetical protein
MVVVMEIKRGLNFAVINTAAFQTLNEALCAAPKQERGSSWTQMPEMSGLEECSPKYRTGRSVIDYSKTSNKAERNYCVTRQELLAIVGILQCFHKYQYGQTARWIQRLKE